MFSIARRSDDTLLYVIDASMNQPEALHTAWQFNPNWFFLPQKNFYLAIPTCLDLGKESYLSKLRGHQ